MIESRVLLFIGLMLVIYLVTTYTLLSIIDDNKDDIRHLKAENKELKKLLK